MRILIILLAFVISLLGINEGKANQPHASITNWQPGIAGPIHLTNSKDLPIWIRLKFDQEVTDKYVKTFFQTLASFLSDSYGKRLSFSPARHGKFTKEFVIVVPRSVTQTQFQSIVDKTNRYFDPEIEMREKLAIQRAKEKAEKELQEKQELERKKREEELIKQAQIEAEKQEKELGRKKAEEQHRAYIEAEAIRKQM